MSKRGFGALNHLRPRSQIIFENDQVQMKQAVGSCLTGFGRHQTDCRPVLESMPGASAQEPNIFGAGMPVKDEILVVEFSYWHTRDSRSGAPFIPRKARLQIGASRLDSSIASSAISMIWIELRTACVISELEATPLISWNSVVELFSVIYPYRDCRDRHFGCPLPRSRKKKTSWRLT